MNKLKFFSAFLIIALSVVYTGCGDDPVTNNNNNGGGSPPNINMKVNSIYAFTNDSLDTNGITVRHTRIRTTNTYISQGTFFGQPNAFEILSESRDTVANVSIGSETFYVRYDGGKFYQYGMLRLIDSTQAPTWDLVADFNVATGTQWTIGTFSTVIGGFAVTTNVKGKVAEQTSFVTNNTGQTINCYRIEIEGAVTSAVGPMGSIFVDYYIGYADPSTNPSGMVRLKLRPIWLKALTVTVYRAPGVDSKIDYYVIPPLD